MTNTQILSIIQKDAHCGKNPLKVGDFNALKCHLYYKLQSKTCIFHFWTASAAPQSCLKHKMQSFRIYIMVCNLCFLQSSSKRVLFFQMLLLVQFQDLKLWCHYHFVIEHYSTCIYVKNKKVTCLHKVASIHWPTRSSASVQQSILFFTADIEGLLLTGRVLLICTMHKMQG